MTQIDWSNVEKDMRLHIVENAKAYIEAQIGLATAADQRAAALAGAFTAAGTALIAGLIAFGTASLAIPTHRYPIFIGGGIIAAGFLSAGLLCVMAIMPAEVYLPGAQPEDWYDSIKAKESYDVCLANEAEIIQDKINDNRKVLGKNARLFKWGTRLGIYAPLVGTITWALTASSYFF